MSSPKLPKKYLETFDTPETLFVVTSFPSQGGELASENAVARYSYLLLKKFPNNKKIVIFCEKRKAEKTYLLKKNILVIPCYSVGSLSLFRNINKVLIEFTQARELLIQFEFSIFGGKELFLPMLTFLFSQRYRGKYVTVSLHQVITDISDLSGHIGVKKYSLAAYNYNLLLSGFYRVLGSSVDSIIVHDQLLKKRLSKYVESEKIVVIPHGIDKPKPSTYHEKVEAKKRFGLKADQKVILIFGYLSWYKGTDWVTEQLGKIAERYPDLNLKVIVAGGESPTQKDNQTYLRFTHKLDELRQRYATLATFTGFLPEKDVETVFKAADLVIYPYRARMSASGALSLAWQYAKPFLVSEPFSTNFDTDDVQGLLEAHDIQASDVTFKLEPRSFSIYLRKILTDKRLRDRLRYFGQDVSTARDWKIVAQKYIKVCSGGNVIKQLTPEKKLSSLSVFFPMYNEEDNVTLTIRHAQQEIPKIADKYEIIIVNDGSTDKTSAKAHRIAKKDPNVYVIDQSNKGYGGALQTGFKQSKYEWIFFSDGDLQFKLEDLALVVTKTSQYKVILGYRKKRADSIDRLILAKLFKIWNLFFFQFPLKIRDIDCAFKLFHRSIIDDILPLHSSGALISAEMLMKINDKGYKYVQVGVGHYPRLFGQQTGAKGHVIFGAMKETLKLLWRRWWKKW